MIHMHTLDQIITISHCLYTESTLIFLGNFTVPFTLKEHISQVWGHLPVIPAQKVEVGES